MTPAPIAAIVEQIIAAIIHDYGLDADVVTQASTFGDDLGMDGEDVHTAIMQCEDMFGVKIRDDFDDYVTERSSVGELTKIVSDLLAEKAAIKDAP